MIIENSVLWTGISAYASRANTNMYLIGRYKKDLFLVHSVLNFKFKSVLKMSFREKLRPRLARIQDFHKDSQKSYDIEANLRSWGLIGHTAIQREDTRTTKVMKFVRKKIFWHRFRLVILWLLTVKLFYSCYLKNDDPMVPILGDVSGYMGVPKLEMGLMMALWTLPGPLVIFEFIKYKNTKRMQSWVKIYDMFSSKLMEGFSHNPIQKTIIDNQIRRKFRNRIRQTKGLFWFFVLGAGTCGGGSMVFTLLARWPEEYRYSIWAYLWSFISVFWIYFNQKSIKSCLIIFNQICYYITLRFQRFDTNLNHLYYNWNKYNETNHRRLLALLRDHDNITDLTLNCNKFWSLFIITNTSIKIPLLLLSIHVSIFYDISFLGRFVALFMTASIFLYTTLIYYSASQVEYTVSQIDIKQKHER